MITGIERFYTPGHRIEAYVETSQGFGGPVYHWKPKHTLAGRLRPLSGDERLSADKQTVFADHRFYCAVEDITEADRYVSPGGDIYDIKFIKDPMSMSNHLEIDLEYTGHTAVGPLHEG